MQKIQSCKEVKDWTDIKGIPMQIWKSPYIFVFKKNQYPKNSTFLILRILELFARKVYKFLKKWANV